MPGFPRALARTLEELALATVAAVGRCGRSRTSATIWRTLRALRRAVSIGVGGRSRALPAHRDAVRGRSAGAYAALPAPAARRARSMNADGARLVEALVGARAGGACDRSRPVTWRRWRRSARLAALSAIDPGPAAGPRPRPSISVSPADDRRPRREADRTRSSCSRRPAKDASRSRSRDACCARRAAACRSIRWRSRFARRSTMPGCSNTRSSAPVCRCFSSAARGGRIRPDGRFCRSWPVRSRTCRRGGSPIPVARPGAGRARPASTPSLSGARATRCSARSAIGRPSTARARQSQNAPDEPASG